MTELLLLPFQDAYISQWYKNTNFSNCTALFVSQYKQLGDDYRSLQQFNLGQIPFTTTIEEASLNLTIYRNESGKPITITVHRLLNDWYQSSVNWTKQPPYSQIADGSVTIDENTPLGKISIDITELVRGWHTGLIPNNGLLIKGNEGVNGLVGFRSSKFFDHNSWPYLQLNYTDGEMDKIDAEELYIPEYPPYAPLDISTPIALGANKQATFLVKNASDSRQIQALIQVGFSDNPQDTFFNSGTWVNLNPQGYPGEAIALTTTDVAEYARVLVKGEGGETVYVWSRTGKR